uniref:Carbonic anhydrase 4 n=1 Tax=Buteo japonicus TaxID=224669 RepID=A0A8C0HN06_9AVES
SQKYEQPHCEAATCKGNKQSPINIVTRNVVYDNSLKPLNFEGYDVKGSSKWNIENNGHTVKVTLSTSPKIGGGGLGRKYKAIEFHLHWGVQGVQQYLPGSEHSIDGEKQAMEVEDVLDITEAKKNADGVAVLAFFIKVGTIWLSDRFSLLPPEEDLGRYYRYKGSLTTPDCHEGVIWTVFEKPIELSISQVSRRGIAWKVCVLRWTLSNTTSQHSLAESQHLYFSSLPAVYSQALQSVLSHTPVSIAQYTRASICLLWASVALASN